MATSMIGNSVAKARGRLQEAERVWRSNGGVGDFVPPTGTKEDYDKLVSAVNASTQKNENIAALRARVQSLGSSVVALAKTLNVI